MGASGLEAVTNELFDMVVDYLEFSDIQQLRLASKAICSKTTQGRSMSYVLRRHVHLTRVGLEAFVRMTSQGGRLGCLVRHLTLVGVLYDTSTLDGIVNAGIKNEGSSRSPSMMCQQLADDGPSSRLAARRKALLDAQANHRELRRRKTEDVEFRDAGKDITLLTQAFRNFARHFPGGLDTLSLQVFVYDREMVISKQTIGARDREYFESAARTFTLVTSALWENNLQIRHFELFGAESDPQKSRLPYDTFQQLNWSNTEHHWSSLRTLKALSLCLSDRLMNSDSISSTPFAMPVVPPPRTVRRKELEHRLSIDSHHSASLVKMQSLCTDLEELRIIWHRLFPRELSMIHGARYPRSGAPRLVASGHTWHHPNGEAQWRARRFYMHELARSNSFLRLRILHLGGLSVHIEDLVKFIENHSSSLREISLDNVQAVDSAWAPLLALLSRPGSKIERIRLEDLQENLAIVHYNTEQESEFTRVTGLEGESNIIERWGEDVTKPIEFFTRDHRGWGTTEHWHADTKRIVKFGSQYADMPTWC